MDYLTKIVTVYFATGVDYLPGDYVRLHDNSGVGVDAIDWVTAAESTKHYLYPNNKGYFGWGYTSWGFNRWGHGESRGVPGWGHLPWGHFPWGHGSTLITITQEPRSPGYYKYGVKAWDVAGNPHVGIPATVEVYVCLTPKTPKHALNKSSYNSVTDVLVLNT